MAPLPHSPSRRHTAPASPSPRRPTQSPTRSPRQPHVLPHSPLQTHSPTPFLVRGGTSTPTPERRARAASALEAPLPHSPSSPTSAYGHTRKSSAYAALAALAAQPYSPSHPHQPPPLRRAGTQPQPLSPGSTPPLSADVRDEDDSEEGEGDEGDEEEEEDELEGEGRIGRRRSTRSRGGRLLTPPATPPRHSLVVVSGSGSSSEEGHDDAQARPTFNARKASAQCRQLEGYVSFAAVEGLGEPPSPGPEGSESEDERPRKAGGLAGLWRSGFW
ncbi:hypothetical protein FB45DRAFT_216919 [Roridomyces roridus]|uniref:Uncharacterized protein n=1 Tax=Roridomyces roridus TaxID=1738132 RepID=A0AAD7BEE4_9AGAR|nr:hypothetical protein FB45DRAFT_216919 [Roridomyces roridus]